MYKFLYLSFLFLMMTKLSRHYLYYTIAMFIIWAIILCESYFWWNKMMSNFETYIYFWNFLLFIPLVSLIYWFIVSQYKKYWLFPFYTLLLTSIIFFLFFFIFSILFKVSTSIDLLTDYFFLLIFFTWFVASILWIIVWWIWIICKNRVKKNKKS